MAPDTDRCGKSASKTKMLTMDVIELTLLLKSIGFRLDSIDYDEFRNWSKKSSEHGNGTNGGASAVNSIHTDADHHYINVEISCSKSKIVSNLTLKFNDSETSVASDAHTATSPSKLIACSCPKRESRNGNNSFWEVQSSGTFSNQRRSINALMNPEAGIDHDTSSNLLPVLSPKSIALTHVLTQILLQQYKINTQFGDASMSKYVDIKSIVQSMLYSEKVSTTQIEDLNLITPVSSMNITPTEQEEGLLNVTMPKVLTDNDDNTSALNETVNTEAFGSPINDMFTSSPHDDNETIGLANVRDTKIINHLNNARQSIDVALLSMKLNVTRSLAKDIAVATAVEAVIADSASGPLTTTIEDFPDDSVLRKRFNSMPPRPPKIFNSRNGSQFSTNARSSMIINRRGSLGSITLNRGSSSTSTTKNNASPALTSRSNSSRPSSADRSTVKATTQATKLSAVRRAVAGIGSRTIGTIASSVKTASQTAASVKRPSVITRRVTGPVELQNSNTTPTGSGMSIRKTTAGSTKMSALPTKHVKK